MAFGFLLLSLPIFTFLRELSQMKFLTVDGVWDEKAAAAAVEGGALI